MLLPVVFEKLLTCGFVEVTFETTQLKFVFETFSGTKLNFDIFSPSKR